jgi:hypothetical protein
VFALQQKIRICVSVCARQKILDLAVTILNLSVENTNENLETSSWLYFVCHGQRLTWRLLVLGDANEAWMMMMAVWNY